MPFGGKNMITEPDGMVHKIPVLNGETKTTALMTYGYNPTMTKGSTFHGGIYSVIESVSKLVCMGADHRKTRLSNQEYFERMVDKHAYGKPFSALLGVLMVQNHMAIPSIGGKDSMSGNFGDMKVPPTVITFAVNHESVDNIISPELKEAGNKLVLVSVKTDEEFVPDFVDLQEKYDAIYKAIVAKQVVAAKTVTFGGIGCAVTKMALGNSIGVNFTEEFNLVQPLVGDMVLEVKDLSALEGIEYKVLGNTAIEESITFANGEVATLAECMTAFTQPLESVFKSTIDGEGAVETISYTNGPIIKASKEIIKPKVFIPVFPGTNCEYDTKRAFEKAGAQGEVVVFNNLNEKAINESIDTFAKVINESQMIALPGGFSASDEPDGSAKFIATILRNPKIEEAVMDMLYQRDGLMVGICNGFQALVKLGLLPYGEMRQLEEGMPTLTFNNITRHISCMSKTRVASNLSPWMANANVGDEHMIAMSHGEGKFVADEATLKALIANGQIATQYVDNQGLATMNGVYNPNGSTNAIEGITSKDGRILGKMGHSERIGYGLYKNIIGETDQKIFQSGVEYFK